MRRSILLGALDSQPLSVSAVGRQYGQRINSQPASGSRRSVPTSFQHVRAYLADQCSGRSTTQLGITHNLADISKRNFNIAHIRRKGPDGTDFLKAVQGQPSLKAVARCQNDCDSISQAVCDLLSQFPADLQMELLSSDMQQVILDFLNASGFEAVDAALSIITQTSCPRFHADHVELRCLCTYAGEGTFFVPNQAVDRRMWMRALGVQDTKGFGIKREGDVQQASEWDLLVLKGNAFPGNQGAGAVHKSPTASHESPRLLLTLDKAREHCCSEC